MEGVDVEAAGFVVAGEVEVVPDPVDVDGGVDAVVLEEGDGDGGDGGGFDVRERAFEDGEAGDADDGLDFAGLNETHDDGAAFGDEDGVAEAFGFILEVLDRAETALFAEEAEFVEGSGAFGFDAQAFRHEEEPAFVGDGGEGFAPHFVVEEDAGVVGVGWVDAGFFDEFEGVDLEFVLRERRDGLVDFEVVADEREDPVAVCLGLRDVFLWLPEAPDGERDGGRQGSFGECGGGRWECRHAGRSGDGVG